MTQCVMNSEKGEILEYFKHKAEDYVLVDHQYYWRLSDAILLEIFKSRVLDKLQMQDKNIRFFDAGAGTGRWTIQILKHYQNATGTAVDFSKDMLAEAQKKLVSMQFDKQVDIQYHDLDQLPVEKFSGYNLAFSFHNVIGFVKDPQKLIANMTKVILPGGYVVVLAPNLYHNVFFNINAAQFDLSEEALKTNKSKFTKDMPRMHMFTPTKLKEAFEAVGLSDIYVSGFPSAIYPQFQETQLHGSTKSLTALLQDDVYFNKILALERSLLNFPDIAARGNQLIVIGKRTK